MRASSLTVARSAAILACSSLLRFRNRTRRRRTRAQMLDAFQPRAVVAAAASCGDSTAAETPKSATPRSRFVDFDSTSHAAFGIRVLWIDDEIREDDALVTLLADDGIYVSCVNSGREGLDAARVQEFLAIILDLRLPDMNGLAVLEQLRGEALWTPVLVLTGFADIETAVKAAKLGAVDYRQKPMFGEDLASAIRSVIEMGDIRIKAPDDPRWWQPTSQTIVRSFQRRLLENSPDDVFIFRAVAFRASVLSRRLARSSREDRTQQSRIAAEMAAREDVHVPAIVLTALGRVRQSVGRGVLLSEAAVGKELGFSGPQVGELFNTHLGIGYREVRRLLRLRPALDALARTAEHVSQIAYTCGFEHVGQFDRDFHVAFGLTPLGFRRVGRGGHGEV
jgi:FixJ family two-component response regulator